MLTMLTILAVSLNATEPVEPSYVLDYPGIAFGWLPEEMIPPVEGTLTQEAGVVTGENTSGSIYYLYYWEEDLEDNSRKDEWLSERFEDMISPDLLPSLTLGHVRWIEGSTESPFRETSSVGLVTVMNFNRINDTGEILSIGRTFAVFTEDHSVLFYMMIPYEIYNDADEIFHKIIANMYLTGE